MKRGTRFFPSVPLAEVAQRGALQVPQGVADKERARGAGRSRPVAVVVDDIHAVADTLAEILRHNGFDASAVYSGSAALNEIEARRPDLVISDVVMPGMNGVQLAKAIRQRQPDCVILLISGQAHDVAPRLISEAGADGMFELLGKPLPPAELLAWIRAKGFKLKPQTGRPVGFAGQATGKRQDVDRAR